MSDPKREYIIIGKIGATYGIKGWLKITSFTEEASQILQYQTWYLAEEHLTNQITWHAFDVESGRQHGKGVVAKLAGFESPETARKLTGKKIAIKREQLAQLPKNEYYWTDLEGLTVIDQKGETLGHIIYLIATGSNDVLVIKDKNNKEHAIPYLPGSVVKQIDLKQQVMHVEWDLL